MPNAASLELDAWMPRLLRVWRALTKRSGHATELSAAELRDVAQGVTRISQGLTRERLLVGARYMDDPQLLGAYLLFYWPISYAQGRSILGELGGLQGRVLDLGSGPGPLALAALDAGAKDAVAADRSAPALSLARSLAGEAKLQLVTRAWDASRGDGMPAGKFETVTMGHVLNELFDESEDGLAKRESLALAALAALKPGGSLVIVEPALRDTSRALLLLRDRLVARGFAVRAPCLFRGPCPALNRATDWCHGERAWEPPPLVADLAEAVGLHKEALKMSYLVLAPAGEDWPALPSGRLFRIVSEPLAGKGRRRFMACGPEGRLGLSMQDKHRTPENEFFLSLERGAVVAVEGVESKGDGLALGPGAKVQRVAAAGDKVVASSS